MKKLIVAAMALTVSYYAHAVAANWNVDYTEISDGSGYADGYAMYYFDNLATGTDVGTIIKALGTDGDLKVLGKALDFGNAGEFGDMNQNIPSGSSLSYKNVAAEGEKADYRAYSYLVLFDDADAKKAKNFWVSEVSENPVSDSVIGGGVLGVDFGALDATEGWSKIAAVPEPTSGLLLLLGVAGLALRRRRA